MINWLRSQWEEWAHCLVSEGPCERTTAFTMTWVLGVLSGWISQLVHMACIWDISAAASGVYDLVFREEVGQSPFSGKRCHEQEGKIYTCPKCPCPEWWPGDPSPSHPIRTLLTLPLERRHFRAWALSPPFVDQRIKFLLCYCEPGLILLAWVTPEQKDPLAGHWPLGLGKT